MCGILYATSRNGDLPTKQLQAIATEFIAPRGPDHRLEFCSRREYACQSVLSIQTKAGIPVNQGCLGGNKYILYNGEVYGKDYSNSSDTEEIYGAFMSGRLTSFLKSIDGMYALISVESIGNESNSTRNKQVELFRDAAGEKHLFYWYSEDYFIAASSPGVIVEFMRHVSNLSIDNDELYSYFSTRHYISSLNLPFKEVKQLEPGCRLTFSLDVWGIKLSKFESYSDLIDPERYAFLSSLSEEEYLKVLNHEFKIVSKNFHASDNGDVNAYTISGGVDSTLFSYYLNCFSTAPIFHRESFTCRFGLKDHCSLDGERYSRKIGLHNHFWVDVSTQQYLDSLKSCIRTLAAPIHSHSLPSSRVLAEFVSTRGHKILYGGEGADELFLGYSTYLDILKSEQVSNKPTSNYSRHENIFDEIISPTREKTIDLYLSVYDKYRSIGLEAKECEVKSNAFVDYAIQLPMVGLCASDTVISECGIESRTPFTRKNIAGLGLNTPVRLLIKEIQEVQITKSPLKSLFSQYIDEAIHPKVGFSGYPNETVTYLGSLRDWRVFEQLPLLRSLWGKDRATNWKIINIEWFLRVWE